VCGPYFGKSGVDEGLGKFPLISPLFSHSYFSIFMSHLHFIDCVRVLLEARVRDWWICPTRAHEGTGQKSQLPIRLTRTWPKFERITSVGDDILSAMRVRTSQIVATLVLVICLVCPVLEMFDHWDHTAQTGNDTEYTFVVLGLCVGVLYTFARFAFGFPLFRFARSVVSSLCAHKSVLSDGQGSFFIVHIPLSPPVLALRI
jgi:hypothetical protein